MRKPYYVTSDLQVHFENPKVTTWEVKAEPVKVKRVEAVLSSDPTELGYYPNEPEFEQSGR